MATRVAFSNQLDEVEELVRRFGEKTASDIRAAGLAASGDKGAEEGILEGREASERLRAEIENKCLNIMLLQQPLVGDDLRFVSSAYRAVSDIAHADSMCRDIAYISANFKKKATNKLSTSKVTDGFMAMCGRSASMVEKAIEAFCKRDEKLAREVIGADEELDRMYEEGIDAVVKLIKAGKTAPRFLIELLMIAKYFERIADQAERIADWAVFRATGERILTVGDHSIEDVSLEDTNSEE